MSPTPIDTIKVSAEDATKKTKMLIYELTLEADNCPATAKELIGRLTAVTQAERDAYAASTTAAPPAPASSAAQAQQPIAGLERQLELSHTRAEMAESRAADLEKKVTETELIHVDLKKQLGQANIRATEAETRAQTLQKELQDSHSELLQLKASPYPKLPQPHQGQPAPNTPVVPPVVASAPRGTQSIDSRFKYSPSNLRSPARPSDFHSLERQQVEPPAKRPKQTAGGHRGKIRKPVCRGCVYSGNDCDGKAQCNHCKPGVCAYNRRAHDVGCIKDICGKIHSSQPEAYEEGRVISGIR